MQKSLVGVVVSAALCFVGASYASGSSFAQAFVAPSAASAHPGGWIVGVDGGYGQLSTVDDNLMDTILQPDAPEGVTRSQSRSIGDFVWGAHVGREFNVTDNFLLGLELGYKDLGRSTYDLDALVPDAGFIRNTGHTTWNIKFEQQALDLLLTGKYYLWEGLNIFGKVGFAYVGAKTTSDYYYDNYLDDNSNRYGANTNYSKTNWRLEPEIALGVGYSVTPNLDVHLTYDYIHGADASNDKVSNSGNNGYISGSFDAFSNHGTVYASNAVLLGVSYSFNP